MPLETATTIRQALDGSIDGAASGVMGTPRYMAPEQFHERADERTDVWGLGVTLYELLTLRPAFASRAEIESGEFPQPRQIRQQPPARPRSHLPESPPQGPTRAVLDGRDFADDLRRWLQGPRAECIEAEHPSPARPLVSAKSRLVGCGVALSLALLVVASGGAIALEAARVAVAESKSKISAAAAEAARQQTRERDRDLLTLRIQQTRLTPKKINWFRGPLDQGR